MGDILAGKKSPWTPVRRTVNEWGTNKRIQTADGGRQDRPQTADGRPRTASIIFPANKVAAYGAR